MIRRLILIAFVLLGAWDLEGCATIARCLAVDGTSLTVSGLTDAGFEVSLIPTTLAETTLGRRAVGDRVNLETDVIAKYVEKLIAWRDA